MAGRRRWPARALVGAGIPGGSGESALGPVAPRLAGHPHPDRRRPRLALQSPTRSWKPPRRTCSAPRAGRPTPHPAGCWPRPALQSPTHSRKPTARPHKLGPSVPCHHPSHGRPSACNAARRDSPPATPGKSLPNRDIRASTMPFTRPSMADQSTVAPNTFRPGRQCARPPASASLGAGGSASTPRKPQPGRTRAARSGPLRISGRGVWRPPRPSRGPGPRSTPPAPRASPRRRGGTSGPGRRPARGWRGRGGGRRREGRGRGRGRG